MLQKLSTVWPQRSRRGHRVKNVKKFCFYGKCFSSYILHSRVTWFRYINRLGTLYKSYLLKFRFWVIWGHRGQKFIFTKNASPHTTYIVWSCDLCIKTSLRPFRKLIDSNFDLGSFGVTGVKKVIFPKNASPPTYYVTWSCDLCTWYTWRPTTKVTILNFDQRSFVVTGVKRLFPLKVI